MGQRKALYQRMTKTERRSLKHWAEGCREDILTPHIEPYADALLRSHVAERDYFARVGDEYNQLIPWRLPDDEEPALPLPKYDPSLIAPFEDLSLEEQQLKSTIIARRTRVSIISRDCNPSVCSLLPCTVNPSLVEIPRAEA